MNLCDVKRRIIDILIRDYNLEGREVSAGVLLETITSSIDLLEFFLRIENEFEIQFQYEEMNYDMITDIEILSKVILSHKNNQ